MEKIDLVIVGAEGVVESGGIINKVSCISQHTGFIRNFCLGGNIHFTLLYEFVKGGEVGKLPLHPPPPPPDETLLHMQPL